MTPAPQDPPTLVLHPGSVTVLPRATFDVLAAKGTIVVADGAVLVVRDDAPSPPPLGDDAIPPTLGRRT